MTTETPTPAAAPSPTPAPAPAAAPPDWTAGLPDEARGYVQNKGFKDPASVVDSYRNMEKLLGGPREKLVRLPDKEDDPAWTEVYEKLGRPKDPKEYDIKVPSEHGDEKFAEWSRKLFHELGISKRQADKLSSAWNEHMLDRINESQQSRDALIQQQDEALKKEWGQAYDEKVRLGQRAAEGLGISAEHVEALEKAMGFAGVMKFMAGLGTKLGEDNFVGSGGGSGGFGVLTPEAAAQKIADLRADKDFSTKYINGDVAARMEMERLHKLAFPGQG